MITTNIRGKSPYPPIMKLDETKELHDCFDCKGCLCEKICEKHEDENFNKKPQKKEG